MVATKSARHALERLLLHFPAWEFVPLPVGRGLAVKRGTKWQNQGKMTAQASTRGLTFSVQTKTTITRSSSREVLETRLFSKGWMDPGFGRRSLVKSSWKTVTKEAGTLGRRLLCERACLVGCSIPAS